MALSDYNSLGIPVDPKLAKSSVFQPTFSTTQSTQATQVAPTLGANIVVSKDSLGNNIGTGVLPSGQYSPTASNFNQNSNSNGNVSQSTNVDGLSINYQAGVGVQPTAGTTIGSTQAGFAYYPNVPNNPTIGKNSQASTATQQPTDLFTVSNNKFLNSYTVTKKDIKDLEKQTNLSLWPWPFGELCYIKHCFSHLNSNTYYLLLSMLVYGFDYKVLTSTIEPKHNKSVIDINFINDFKNMVNDPLLRDIIKKTPAYQKGCFENVGCYGMTYAGSAGLQDSSPITGSSEIHSSLVTDLLERIHKGSTQELINFCNKIRTHTFLSLPKGCFGSLQRIIARINGVVEAFSKIVADMYQGCIQLVQKAYALINGIVSKMQKELMKLINKIIPLDLLCTILDTFQVLLDDVNFFTSLFQMSGPFMNYLNTFQNYLNLTSQYVSNPFSTIQSYFPAQVNNIINTVNQIGADPNGYLADKLNNFGYGYVLNALQGNIYGALINKFGPQYAAITPLGNILTKGTAIYSHFGGQFPQMPATMGPNIYTGSDNSQTDSNGNPITGLQKTLINDYNDFTKSLGELFKGTSSDTKTDDTNSPNATTTTPTQTSTPAPASVPKVSQAVQDAILSGGKVG